MDKPSLSATARNLLQANDYSILLTEDTMILKSAGETRILIVILGVVFTCFMVLISMFLPVMWVLTFVVLVIAFGQYKKATGATDLYINSEEGFFHLGKIKRPTTEVTEVRIESTKVDEYASAFKETVDAYQVRIVLLTNSGQSFSLVTFQGDYSDPSQAMIEVFECIKWYLVQNHATGNEIQ